MMTFLFSRVPSLLLLLSATTSSIQAFSPTNLQQHHHQCRRHSSQTTTSPSSTQRQQRTQTTLQMSDFDFPSAMPEKPTLSPEDKLRESATTFIADITARLGKGVEEPPELEALRVVRDGEGSDVKVLALKIYELMIEQGMKYDVDANTGVLTPTQFDIKNNLDVPEVKAEFNHLYKYGMELIRRGMIDVEVAKDVVKTRLIERTGLTPEEFDEWLGY
eukprot:g1885.t1 g1885   contig11:270496-271551(+)